MVTLVHIDSVVHFATIPNRHRVFALLSPFLVVVQTPNGTDIPIKAPTGFVTDFASVPRAVWTWIPPYGKHVMAAVTHDWLYHSAPTWMTRKQADQLFLLMMGHAGVGWMRRRVMYAAVRVRAANAGNWRAA